MFIEKFIKKTIEYQNIGGWNEISISFIVMLFLTIIQAIGLWKQKTKIGKAGEKTSLSLILFSFLFSYFIDYGIYGIYKYSLTIILSNFFLGLFFIPIIIKIIKHQKSGNGFSKIELIIAPFSLLLIPGIIFMTDKDLFLTILLFFSGLSLIPQGIKFLKTRGSNDFEPLFVFSFLLSAIVWLIVGLKIDSQALIRSSIPTICLTGISLGLYYLNQLINRKKSD